MQRSAQAVKKIGPVQAKKILAQLSLFNFFFFFSPSDGKGSELFLVNVFVYKLSKHICFVLICLFPVITYNHGGFISMGDTLVPHYAYLLRVLQQNYTTNYILSFIIVCSFIKSNSHIRIMTFPFASSYKCRTSNYKKKKNKLVFKKSLLLEEDL